MLHLARRLQLGTIRYSNVVDGRVAAESRIRIQRLAGGRQYAFSNVVDGFSDQHWQAVISSGFTPITAELTFGLSGVSYKAFDLFYTPKITFLAL